MAIFRSLMLQNILCNTLSKASSRRNATSSCTFAPFSRIPLACPLEATQLQIDFIKDTSPQKVNLASVFYRVEGDQLRTLSVVRKAEIGVACDDFLSHEPMPPLGNEEFTNLANELILGPEHTAIHQKRAFGVQSRTGVDALNLAAKFLREKMEFDLVLVSRPSWPLCEAMFQEKGFKCQSYQYSNSTTSDFNVYGLVADLMSAPEGSVVVLDVCAHSSTGIDPTVDEWKLIGHIMKCKKMLPLFHLETQGLASGDPKEDAWPVRYFADCGFDLFCAQSFVTNFGLYNEAVSNLLVVLSNPVHLESAKSQFESMLYTNNQQNCSIYASRIVAKILANETLRNEWLQTVTRMHNHITNMRTALSSKLKESKTPGIWQYLNQQKGMFAYTNLTSSQIRQLLSKHIYLPQSGRLNLSALNSGNVDYVARAIDEVVHSKISSADDYYMGDPAHLLYHYFNTV